MASIIDRRVTAHIQGDFVVFLIGMRINKPWKPHKWLLNVRTMPKMLKELEAAPAEHGFLGYTNLGLFRLFNIGAASITSRPMRERATKSTGPRGSNSIVS